MPRTSAGYEGEPNRHVEYRAPSRRRQFAQTRAWRGPTRVLHDLPPWRKDRLLIRGRYANELPSLWVAKPRSRQRPLSDEVAVVLEHPPEPEIVGCRSAVQLRSRNVPFLDAERIDRIDPVRGDAER